MHQNDENSSTPSGILTEETIHNPENTFVNSDVPKTTQNQHLKEIYDFLKDLVIIVLVVVFIRSYFILPFQISGQSMYDSYYDREFIIVDRFSYLDLPFAGSMKNPTRGDVVVFNTHIEGKEYFIKRIIATPGEMVKIAWGKVYVKAVGAQDFVYLDEKYLMDGNYNATYVRGSDEENIYTVPEGQYFVMGDNRNASTDSRACFSSCDLPGKSNFISKDDLVGKVLLDLGYFSFSQFGFTQPDLWIETKPRFLSSPSTYQYK